MDYKVVVTRDAEEDLESIIGRRYYTKQVMSNRLFEKKENMEKGIAYERYFVD